MPLPRADPREVRGLTVYRWSIAGPARPQFQALPRAARDVLVEFMNAAVLLDPMEFRRSAGEGDREMRWLPFGPHDEGVVTFYVHVRGEHVLVIQIIWAGEG